MITVLALAAVLVMQQPQATQEQQVASPTRQQQIMQRIKAEREAKGTPVSKPMPSPSDVNPRARLRAKRLAQRSWNAKQEAAQVAAARREALMMLPYQLELNRQVLNAQTAKYQADMRYQGDRAIANGLKGVSAPPY